MTQVIDCVPSSARPAARPVDFEAVKARQRAMWASGDFAVIGTTLQIVGESLCEAADVLAGSRALDVACGNGNAALAAARRLCRTTGVDYVPELLERARQRAEVEHLPVELLEGDAEKLPFDSASFDYVLSTFGVMFAPNQAKAADELLRVCVPGGKVALASWTPEGFLGELFRTVGRFIPPAPGLQSPFNWGSEAGIESLFGERVEVVYSVRKDFVFRYESPAHFVNVLRTYYGPTHQAFKALDEQKQAQLQADLERLAAVRSTTSAACCVPGEYLEIVLERRA